METEDDRSHMVCPACGHPIVENETFIHVYAEDLTFKRVGPWHSECAVAAKTVWGRNMAAAKGARRGKTMTHG